MEFEDYNASSKTYDEFRVPIGLDSLDACLKLASDTIGIPINELKILDVGCGTGNYISVLKEKVASCHGLEFNDGMLKAASTRHEGDARVILQ